MLPSAALTRNGSGGVYCTASNGAVEACPSCLISVPSAPRSSTVCGCVRLESAWRLSRWLFGRDLTWKGAGTEEEVKLDKPVPVYITYLTAVPDGSQVAFLDDVYGRDKARLAKQSDGGLIAAAR